MLCSLVGPFLEAELVVEFDASGVWSSAFSETDSSGSWALVFEAEASAS